MSRIDESRPFVPVKIAVLTVSDTRSLEDDRSGQTLAGRIEEAGHVLAGRAIVSDDVEKIRAQVRSWAADPAIDVIITTGGTGFTGRDVTPEALEPLFEKRMDGFRRSCSSGAGLRCHVAGGGDEPARMALADFRRRALRHIARFE